MSHVGVSEKNLESESLFGLQDSYSTFAQTSSTCRARFRFPFFGLSLISLCLEYSNESSESCFVNNQAQSRGISNFIIQSNESYL